MTYYAVAGSFTTTGLSPDGDTIRFQPEAEIDGRPPAQSLDIWRS